MTSHLASPLSASHSPSQRSSSHGLHRLTPTLRLTPQTPPGEDGEHFLGDLLFRESNHVSSSSRPTAHSSELNDFLAIRRAMPSPPINIATPRPLSRSPQSNLTSQLQQNRRDSNLAQENGAPVADGEDKLRARQESVSNFLSTTPFGARSIPHREGARRESNAVSGSFMGGMSWGGISMGSFIRDE